MIPATEAERAWLGDALNTLCRIHSPSGREGECARWIRHQLEELGLEVEQTSDYEGSEAANLLARIPGRRGQSILLCAHMDTVPPLAPIEPVLVEDGWENAHDGILGADNKAAVAVLLALARRMRGAGAEGAAGPAETGIELLFTVCEEIGLRGADAFEVGRLHSDFGYVMDHATPIGEVIVASPTLHAVHAELRGRAAHAGICPELGRSAIAAAARAVAAMQIGRLDSETTANVGTISGGSATNVIAERCTIEAEVRSIDSARAEEVVTEMVDHLQDAANAGECDLDVTVECLFRGYRVAPRAAEVALAEQALHRCGYTPRAIESGGGSDANAFRAAGFPCLNLANGTERAHEPTERVSIDALEGMLDVVIALKDEFDRAPMSA